MSYPDMWGEGTALVAIAASGGSYIQFAASTPTIDIDQGDKDFEAVPTTRGGRLEKRTPEDTTTITFEIYSTNLDTGATGNDVIQRFFTTRANWDTSEAFSVVNSRNRDDYAVVVLWTEDSTVTSADSATALAEALRFIMTKGRLISAKPTFTDNELKFTVKFKCSPYRADGTPNVRWQSNDATPSLPGLAAYTGQAASAL